MSNGGSSTAFDKNKSPATEHALESLEKWINIDPLCDEAYKYKGDVLNKIGIYNESVRFYIKAIELNSKNLLPRTKHRIYLTQKPDSFGEALQLKLKENNLENFFHIENLNINLIALDNNILTMDLDLKYCLKSLYLENKSSDSDKDRQSIYKQIADSL